MLRSTRMQPVAPHYRCPVALVPFALVCALVFAVCASPSRYFGAARTRAVARLHVLAIDGGSSPAENYQSHLLHVEQLLDVLARAGVPPRRIAIFSSDGADPAPDLAVRELQPETDFWLLEGTRLERSLRTPVTYVNSAIAGMALESATKAGLRRWFERARWDLRPGDVLLIYVTDHGTKNPEDSSNNRITLWGKGESLSVSELEDLLELLHPQVRVVMLMSQCYSGAFAHLMAAHAAGGAPSGAVCGYFSSTAERPAYGCYPENRGRENVGHSFEFIAALAAMARFPDAHAQVLVSDRTPDVPIKTSDIYLEELLGRVAGEGSEDVAQLADALLREAWRDKGRWEPEIRLLDRIGHAFGWFSPRSLAELAEQEERLPEAGRQLRTYARAWEAALADTKAANLDHFVAASPDWSERLDERALKKLEPAAARELTAALLEQFAPFTWVDPTVGARLGLLKGKAETAAPAAYRMEVRAAVVLRMRAVLMSIAGRVYLDTRATPAERTAYEALHGCEDLALDASVRSLPIVAVPVADPFPPYEEDLTLAQEVLPAWMGIRFGQVSATQRASSHLEDGAAVVEAVYPDSPAKAARFEVGDIVVGPPGAPFSERNQIREWTMLSKIDEPATLVILRGERRLRLTLVPKAYPLKWPELPGPPKVGRSAPQLGVTPYRGALPASLANGTPHLLFFWATWCGPCKAAVPEILDFERARKTPVIAVTDEPPEQLETFFQHYDGPFPATVAVDKSRRTFLAYAVSGTPTVVLVDANGKVGSYSTGYSREKGLGIDGWSWAKRDTDSPAQ
jgi:thiol-disulfide isomerase/thioredoxin